jgi:hypothetical protein
MEEADELEPVQSLGAGLISMDFGSRVLDAKQDADDRVTVVVDEAA